MMTVRNASERGHAQHGWLDTYHTFSFANYYDEAHMGFRALRVINDDRVAASMGFGMHPHRDMEIITYILDGQLEHRDSMGNGGILKAGAVQVMSAGRGLLHSELNPSAKLPLHLNQIWIEPNEFSVTPRYAQMTPKPETVLNRWRLIASADARDASLPIHQDASVYVSRLEGKQTLKHELAKDRHAWLQVMTGSVGLNGRKLEAGDGVSVSDEKSLTISGGERDSEIMLFDLA
jgi:redox-sensitive bicupin YhaK (pirin superfamily)